MPSFHRELALGGHHRGVTLEVRAHGPEVPHIGAITVNGFWHSASVAMTFADLERFRDRINAVLLEARAFSDAVDVPRDGPTAVLGGARS